MSLIGANHRLDILSGAICELLLVNIVYLLGLVKVLNTQYILSQWFTVFHLVVIVIVVVVKTFNFFRFPTAWTASADKRKNEMFSLQKLLLLQPNATQ